MVLAAGLGRRLRPLTVHWPKPALPVLGRPLIEYTMALLRRAGVREVVVNLHHQPDSIKRILSGPAGESFRIHYSHEAEILGTAGGLKRAGSWLGEEPFLVINGDTIVDVDLRAIVEWHRKAKAKATLLLRPRPLGSAYTVITVGERGRILSLGGEDLASPTYMFAGVWVLDPEALARLCADRIGGLEKELLPELMREGSAFGYIEDAPWFELGTPRHYLGACLDMARHGVHQELWRASAVRPPRGSSPGALVVSGTGTIIDSHACFHGESVLGACCRLRRGCTVPRSVIW
ncbi:MAG: NDP-sugar synthase, partial [Acidobacteriota bacterium]